MFPITRTHDRPVLSEHCFDEFLEPSPPENVDACHFTVDALSGEHHAFPDMTLGFGHECAYDLDDIVSTPQLPSPVVTHSPHRAEQAFAHLAPLVVIALSDEVLIDAAKALGWAPPAAGGGT